LKPEMTGELSAIISIRILLINSSYFQAHNRKNGQMQLIDRIEHACQGSLILQLALEGGDRGAPLQCGLKDRHSIQAIRPDWVEPSFYTDLVKGWAIEGDGFPRRYPHYE
jgi:hypothetical protein